MRGIDNAEIIEELELWYRDPVECIRDLISNPLFNGKTSYAPENHFEDAAGNTRIWSEMNTGDWWWEVQVRETWLLLHPSVVTCTIAFS